MAADCIFCKIAAGQIPATTFFTSDDALAFLDIAPLAPGHALLIPRAHYARLGDMPAEAAAGLAAHLPRLVQAILGATGAAGVNILQNNGRAAGQVVDHVHFHLIPRSEGDRLGYRWNAGKYAPGQADELQRRLLTALA